jgi:hypothetical protein
MTCSIRCLIILTACCLLGFPAGAQMLPLPPALRSKPVLDQAEKRQIQMWVAEAFAGMGTGGDQMRTCREAVMAEVKSPASCSPAFLAAYAEAVAAGARSTLGSTAEIGPRIAMGFATARVAEATALAQLEPAAVALLGDSSPAVQMWGVRVARFITPEMTKVGTSKNLIEKVVAAAKANPIGPVIEDAYEALKPGPAGEGVGLVFEPLVGLLEMRLATLKTGIPDDPVVDYKPLSQLGSTQAVWLALKPEQRQRVMQLIQDSLVMAAARGEETKRDPVIRYQFGGFINKTVQTLRVIAKITQDRAADAATRQAAGNLDTMCGRAELSTASATSIDRANFQELMKNIPPAIRGIEEFAKLKDPVPPAPLR